MLQKSYPLNFFKEFMKIVEEDFNINKETYFKDIFAKLNLKSFFLYEFCEDESFIKKLYSLEKFYCFDDNIQGKEDTVFDLMNIVNHIKEGECFSVENLEQLPNEWFFEREYFEKKDIKNITAIPIPNNKKADIKGFILMEWAKKNNMEEKNILNELSYLGYLLMYNRKVSDEKKSLKFEIDEKNLLLDNSEACMWYLLNASTFGAVNKSFASFWGKTKEQIQFKTLYDVLGPEVAEKMVIENLEVFEGAKKIKKQRWYVNANGKERLLLITYIPKFDTNKNIDYIVCSAEDRTEANKYQQDLIKAREEAEMSSLLKSRFLANMSHEIRTPLNGIVGFLNILEQTSLNQEQKEYIKNANFACSGLLGVINDILDISKIEAGMLNLKNVSFNLTHIVKEIIAFWSLKAKEKKLLLELVMSDKFTECFVGDSQRLRQILNNLISNAIKFTEEGCVILKIKKTSENNESCKILFKIEDTGIGIASEDIKKLFKPFVQVESSSNRTFGGTGLGLAISNDLVQMMEGNLTVESTQGSGTVFSFEIEFKKQVEIYDDTKKEDDVKSSLNKSDLSKLKILMVEDNKINQKVANKILEKNGMKCDIAQNGQQGLELFKEGEYDLILMDCEMPVMDGYEATKNIRKIQDDYSKKPVIIAMTANVMDGEKDKCIKIGMNDYISKPVNAKVIVETIRKYF